MSADEMRAALPGPARLARRLLAVALAAVAITAAAQFRTAQSRDRVDEVGLVVLAMTVSGLMWAAAAAWRTPTRPTARPVAAGVTTQLRGAPLTGAATSGEVAVSVQDVRVEFGARTALAGISLEVHRGEIVGLLGPNGAGKTTTVDVCCGLRIPDGGRATILGIDAASAGPQLRRAIGVVPQDSGLYPELTGREHLEMFAALYGLRRPAGRIAELLELLALAERRDSRVDTYSGGMRRRLALARALLHDPPVLFLDEPTLGVDVHGRRVLWEHVLRLRDDGRSVLLTTNYLDEATALCDRVVIIDRGSVVADESPAALRQRSGTTLVLTVDDEVARRADAVRQACPGVDVEVVDGELRARLATPAMATAVIAAAGSVTSLRTEQPSLEDVFLTLTGRPVEQ